MIALYMWLAGSAAHAQEAEPQPTRVTASVVVAVTQRDDAADSIVAKAKELGGWFQSRTGNDLALRVPIEGVDALMETAAAQGKVIDRAITREDVGQAIADTAGRLEAREDVLERYYAVLRTAGSDSIVAVERQIVGAIEQIETLKGRLKLLEDEAAYGRVDVSFQFRDRAAPARDGSSSFQWLNTLNVQDVIAGHQQERPAWRTRGASLPKPPDGFSAWRKRGRYRAASPDNVLVRIRSEKHKPKAVLPFWKEAVRERMVAAGYSVQGEEDLAVSGAKGALIELAAPLGPQDWSYLVAFFPRGGKLVVFEAAGEVATLDARRQALIDAVNAMNL
ncbi:MAG: DUF4349 domain-containing protein [Myxococcales bacterium]|nr:DUF4349 domain-containing protein [Myxococcales bacterium]